jgi:sugar O-acyltransferase (sialic acid O-acetyltransferase NeuD family)
MKNTLAIIGAGDLGQHIAHYAALSNEFSDIVFFDDTMDTGFENSYGKVIGSVSSITNSIKTGEINNLLIGIGYKHMEIRENLYNQFGAIIKFPNIIHESCYIDKSVLIGNGNVLLPGCIIDKGCMIGNNIFFNPGCIIAHDNNIQDHTFFAPGVTTSGFVNIGSCCFLGTRTNMVDNIIIGDNIQTGAGTLITKNITESGIYKGIPGKLTK